MRNLLVIKEGPVLISYSNMFLEDFCSQWPGSSCTHNGRSCEECENTLVIYNHCVWIFSLSSQLFIHRVAKRPYFMGWTEKWFGLTCGLCPFGLEHFSVSLQCLVSVLLLGVVFDSVVWCQPSYRG